MAFTWFLNPWGSRDTLAFVKTLVGWAEFFKYTTSPNLTMLKNYSKCRIWIFQFWHFPIFFETDLSGNPVSPQHGVWKSPKKIALRAKRATSTIWVDKNSLKIPKNGQFGKFLKTWNLRPNSVTRQLNFNLTTIGEKCQNKTIKWDILGNFQTELLIKIGPP